MQPRSAVVTVTGAAGQIGYALLFRIASGAMLGKDTRIDLRLLEIPQALGALGGVAMELEDCAFSNLKRVHCTDEADKAFADCDYALLVGALPRKAGMERKDLLAANAGIFSTQGAALNRVASRDVRVLVVGNPANTNALITRMHAPDIPARQITAMTRLDHNRAIGMLAKQTAANPSEISQLTVWGNHSVTQYPDLYHAKISGTAALKLVEEEWYRNEYIPAVQKRGASVIDARGASSAASAANAAIQHMHDWVSGTPKDDWTSMGVVSDGSYDISAGLVYSFPVRCHAGSWEIVRGLELNDYSRKMLDQSAAELRQEQNAVEKLQS